MFVLITFAREFLLTILFIFNTKDLDRIDKSMFPSIDNKYKVVYLHIIVRFTEVLKRLL